MKFLQFEYNRKIKYMQIFKIAYYHKFIRTEYQHFRDVIRNMHANDNTSRNRKQIA